MGKKIDLTGQRFGKWTVIEKSDKRDSHRNVLWACQCDCGVLREVKAYNLTSGSSSGCGCYVDLTGERFGRLTVTTPTKKRNRKRCVIWACLCDCGKTKEVASSFLNDGSCRSCGCLLLDTLSGENNHNYNHNLTNEERLYNRYQLYGKTMKNWSRNIYFVDWFTCQACGDHQGGKLNAHHLNAWKSFPEQRFDTANGITLCEECHKEYHHFNGRGNNTLEEFRDHIACMVGEEHVSEIEETLLSRESEIIGQEQPTRELQTT